MAFETKEKNKSHMYLPEKKTPCAVFFKKPARYCEIRITLVPEGHPKHVFSL